MATVGELKIHVTTCGIPELEHLLAMLWANTAVLPGVVVRAMESLAIAEGIADAEAGNLVDLDDVKAKWLSRAEGGR